MDLTILEALEKISHSPKSFYEIKDKPLEISQLHQIYDQFEPDNFNHKWIYRGLALNPNCDDSLLVKLANHLDHFVAYSAGIKIKGRKELLEDVKIHWHENVRIVLNQENTYQSIVEEMRSKAISSGQIFELLEMNLMVINSYDPFASSDECQDKATILGLSDSFEEDDLSLIPSNFESYEELIADLSEIYHHELIASFWHSELIISAALNPNLDIDKFLDNYFKKSYLNFVSVGMGSFFRFSEIKLGPKSLWDWLELKNIYTHEYPSGYIANGPSDYLLNAEPVYGSMIDNWHFVCLPFNNAFPDSFRIESINHHLKSGFDITDSTNNDISDKLMVFLHTIACILTLQDRNLLKDLSAHSDEGIRKAVELNTNS
jgi:hypothetical protein